VSISQKLVEYFYSDEKYNGTKRFYDLIRTDARPDTIMLNLGAGPATRSAIRQFKGTVHEVCGADIDPVVMSNDELDKAVLIENGKVDFPSGYFDLIYSDFVIEHVENPKEFLAETIRMLKPGGKFFFRTPNLFHYVAIISWITPQSFHEFIANRIRQLPEDAHEPWPTFYRLNTRTAIETEASAVGFSGIDVEFIEPNPSYLQFHPVPLLLGVAYERTVNSTDLLRSFRSNIIGTLAK
jgi:SAM-dependent methyltransferase